MSDDALQSSEWGDAVSANPRFVRVEDELADTLEGVEIKGDDGNENNQAEQEEEHEQEQEQEEETQDKDRKLLSALTEGADKPFVTDTITSPSKDEALFKNVGSTLKLDPTDIKTTTTTTTTITTTTTDSDDNGTVRSSPTKLRRHNVYRAPRHRRTPLKQAELHSDNANDPLGPLGAAEIDANIHPSTSSPATKLFQDADKPLFEINRTPLSPLKKQEEAYEETMPPLVQTNDDKRTSPSETSETPEETAKELSFKMKISVGDPVKVGDLTGAHIVYSVRTHCDSELFKSPQVMVSRRYRDFRWLYRQLQSTHPGKIIPPPPDKQAVGRFNEDFIEGRRFALEKMLIKIAQNPSLHQDPDFLMFLQSERFASEAREREKAAGATSVFSEHENDSMNNSSAGFLSSIGGAFSFTPKIVEPDEYLKDKKSYIEALNQQYKAFLKNLETVIIQRQDLSSVTEEFANIITTLADLEISKSSTEIFQEFSNTQMRIKELLDRVSLQDMLTIGATLDEYMRIINSIKTVFQQRDKILVQLSVSETDLKKKQAPLDRYVKYNKTQTEKIQALRGEIAILDQKHKAVRERYDAVTKTIKEDLETFEVEKIHDFRNTIEIFLESTIESQKEAVELWETFYNLHLST